MTENQISYKVIGAAICLKKNVGPDLLESAYENALAYDLREIGFEVKQQLDSLFEEISESESHKEIKAVECLIPVNYAQVLTYLKLSGIKLGLLINFNAKTLKDNIHRIVNNL